MSEFPHSYPAAGTACIMMFPLSPSSILLQRRCPIVSFPMKRGTSLGFITSDSFVSPMNESHNAYTTFGPPPKVVFFVHKKGSRFATAA